MKKCLLGLAIVFAAVSANAAFLYWQVGGSDVTGVGTAYNTAILYAQKAGDEKVDLVLYDKDIPSPTLTTDLSKYSYDFSSTEGGAWSFFVELYNYDSTTLNFVSTSETKTYAQLLEDGNIIPDALGVGNMHVWTGGTYSVPEPTSGLLMMLGFALVGLRRRKV